MSVTIDSCEYSTDVLARTAYAHHILSADMTANDAPSGVASADSELDASRKAFRAYDQSNINDEVDCWHSTNTVYPHWNKYQFPQKEVVTCYALSARPADDCVTDWVFQGSNNDSDWDTLDTQSSQTFTAGQRRVYTFSNTTPYTYYHIYASAGNNGNYAIIGELELYHSACDISGGYIHDNIVMAMTAYNAPSPMVVTESSYYTGARQQRGWRCFDKLTGASDNWETEHGNTTGWVKVDIGTGNAETVTVYTIRTQNHALGINRAPKAWTLQGSNNDSDWDTLDTISGETGWGQDEQRTYFVPSNTTAYRYYMLDITENNGDADCVSIGELQYFAEPIVAQSESTIVHDGTYSLKVTASTNSLNKSIHKVLSATDISAEGEISFWVRSSRTGSNIKFGFMDSGGTITETTPNILSADTFQECTLNISGIGDSDLDGICKVIITIVNADSANTFYIDNIVAQESLAGANMFFCHG